MSRNSHHNSRGPRGGGGQRSQAPDIDLRRVVLKAKEGAGLDPDLFSGTAQEIAKVIGRNKRGNKPTQIRKFFDELVMWEERVRQDQTRFAEYLPFIRMLNAKAAYAEGRQNVDANFVALIAHCLDQVSTVETLHNFKLFFEAFLGFYKLHGPRG